LVRFSAVASSPPSGSDTPAGRNADWLDAPACRVPQICHALGKRRLIASKGEAESLTADG